MKDPLLILISKAKRILREKNKQKKKHIHIEILDSCLKFGCFYCIYHPLDHPRQFFALQSYFP